jgi:hypothetical protein
MLNRLPRRYSDRHPDASREFGGTVTCRTVDRARLNTFKSQSHSDTSTHTLGLGNTNTKRQPSPSEPASPLGEYMFYAPAPKPDEEGSQDEEDSQQPPAGPTRHAKTPHPTTELSSTLRAPPRKIGSKDFFLNLFRKAGDNSPESPYVNSSWSFSTPPSTSPSHAPIYMPLHPHLVWYWGYRLWAW